MRRTREHLEGLVQLGRIEDAEEQRAVFRQSMASLAAAVSSQEPVPLEGLDPSDLLATARLILERGFVEKMSFLSPAAGAAALYELAAALPVGDERRDLGRRVLRRLHSGDAPTFVALATQLALGSRRALSGSPIRARVALALDLPIGVGARADALALALISRRDVEREWLTLPSSGSLPSRRLAARLLERAAREAARRAAQGDDSGLRVFEMESVQVAFHRLLSDRESLVWRHVASARGLLSDASPEYAEEVTRQLSGSLSPTEWRRSAASLTASVAVSPVSASKMTRELLASEIVDRDPGIVGAMILGLPRAAEAEPSAAEELLSLLVQRGRPETAESIVELRRERVGTGFGAWASERARAELRQVLDSGTVQDDGLTALLEALHGELAADGEQAATTLPGQIDAALIAFAEHGAEAAYAEALRVLESAEGSVGTLVLTKGEDSAGRRHVFRALRELDVGLLEKGTLSYLLTLGGADQEASARLSDVFGQLTDWLLAREATPVEDGDVPHLTLRLQRMRTMLHLADADSDSAEDKSGDARRRRLRTASLLLERVEKDVPSPLRRIVCASAARACDALVREEIVEVSDVLLALGAHVEEEADLDIFAEASMVPEIEAAVRGYTGLGTTLTRAAPGGSGERACLDAILHAANSLPVASSPRVEALRSALLGLVRALETVARAGSLAELAEGTEGTLLMPLEAAVQSLAQLVAGARRRFSEDDVFASPGTGAVVRMLDFAVERAIRGNRGFIAEALAAATSTLRQELPRLVGEVVAFLLHRIVELPDVAPRRTRVSFVPAILSEAPLPGWLPPSRIVGGFYVLRSLGSGAGGSVFVARRAEDRHQSDAERFALKVPEYDGAAARTLSEAQFLQMFREEAGALLSLPHNKNIARFETFDAGARPKPLLVMELVEGPSLERAVEMGDLTLDRAFELLDGIATGLSAMHALGIGHLDVKPSNVILRDPDGLSGPEHPGEPVLVDFGLAGRHVRPGCATGEYGAPEIWAGEEDLAPMPADVYAFGCVAFELLTGKTLFEGSTAMALITMHVAHDGHPPAVETLAADESTAALAKWLSRALRRDAPERASIDELRADLPALRRSLNDRQWPLPTGAESQVA